MGNDMPRLIELLAESLIRQDQLYELMQQLQADHRLLHDKFDTHDANYTDLLRRLERIEMRQDQQQQVLLQLLEVFVGRSQSHPPAVGNGLPAPVPPAAEPRPLPGTEREA